MKMVACILFSTFSLAAMIHYKFPAIKNAHEMYTVSLDYGPIKNIYLTMALKNGTYVDFFTFTKEDGYPIYYENLPLSAEIQKNIGSTFERCQRQHIQIP